MFERYTEEARRAIFLARYEADRRGSNEITLEDLLLGLLLDPASRVNRIVAVQHLAEQLRKTFAFIETTGKKNRDLPVNNAVKRALAYTAEEAEKIGENWHDSAHLLLGILREKDSKAALALNGVGVTLEQVREKVRSDRIDPPTIPPVTFRPRGFAFKWWQGLIAAAIIAAAMIWFKC